MIEKKFALASQNAKASTRKSYRKPATDSLFAGRNSVPGSISIAKQDSHVTSSTSNFFKLQGEPGNVAALLETRRSKSTGMSNS